MKVVKPVKATENLIFRRKNVEKEPVKVVKPVNTGSFIMYGLHSFTGFTGCEGLFCAEFQIFTPIENCVRTGESVGVKAVKL